MGLTRPRSGQINFDATNITDPLIRINSGQSQANDKDAGWVVERGSDANVALIWDESADEFVLANTTEDGTTSGNVTISSYAGMHVGSFIANGLTYPTSDGTNGQVLQTDGSGTLSFADGGGGISLAAANTWTAGQRGEITALTSASTITIDMANSNNFSVTLAHNATFANPSNLTAGQSGSIFLTQDGTGSRTASWGSNFDFAGGTAPTLTTTASAVDRIDYVVLDSSNIHAVATLALS
jgi:hypothetical protein